MFEHEMCLTCDVVPTYFRSRCCCVGMRARSPAEDIGQLLFSALWIHLTLKFMDVHFDPSKSLQSLRQGLMQLNLRRYDECQQSRRARTRLKQASYQR